MQPDLIDDENLGTYIRVYAVLSISVPYLKTVSGRAQKGSAIIQLSDKCPL